MPVGFTVRRNQISGSAMGTTIEFTDGDSIITNYGNAFQNNREFRAPASGLYHFSLSFVREPYYTQTATNDDVYIKIRKNKNPLVMAWAGESSATASARAKFRETGTVSVVVQLNQNDEVDAHITADGVARQFTANNIVFSGFKVA